MVENPYKFQYCGRYPKAKGIELPLNTDPDIIKLYRGGSREIVIDFPVFFGPFENTKPCREGFSAEDVQFLNKHHQLGLTDEDIGACKGSQILRTYIWEFNCMGLNLRSRFPVPFYECDKCGAGDSVYRDMIGQACSYILGNVAIRYHHQDPNVMFSSIHV